MKIFVRMLGSSRLVVKISPSISQVHTIFSYVVARSHQGGEQTSGPQ